MSRATSMRHDGTTTSRAAAGVPSGASALGADRGIHLCDRAFAGADTLATARALATALRREPFDLVLCGRASVDEGASATWRLRCFRGARLNSCVTGRRAQRGIRHASSIEYRIVP